MSNYLRKLTLFLLIIIFSTKFWTHYLFLDRKYIIGKRQLHNGDKSKIKLRVLSYNLFMLPDPFFLNMLDHKHSDFKNERCEIISKLLGNFDIIMFQEIHPYLNFRCTNIIENAKKSGLSYHYYSLGPTFFSKYILSNGLLILSRYPIKDCDYLAFKRNNSYDSLMEKGVIYSKIEISSKFPPLYIFNTHLQASYSKNKDWEKIRVNQLNELQSFIHSKCNLTKDTIILGGDFNINYYDIEYQNICKKMYFLSDTFKEVQKPLINHTITIPYDKDYNEMTSICMLCNKCKLNHVYHLEQQKLDYILYNKYNGLKHISSSILPLKIKSKDYDFTQLSDHYAYVSIFELTRKNN